MEKNKEAYLNYVCPYCWNTLNECTCELFPPYHLVFIDQKIQEHIRILNSKGYCTAGCCEGHMDICVNTYLTFVQDYFDDDTILPTGFVYDRKKRTIRHEYRVRRLAVEDFEKEKKEHIERLLMWCKGLLEINQS